MVTSSGERGGVGFSTEDRLPATRYKQGNRTVYGLHLTPAELTSVVPRPDPEVSSPGNRRIRPEHAARFAEYVIAQEDWVSPGVILRAPSVFRFDADGAAGGQRQIGALIVQRRDLHEIQVLDGQHRILGFHIALERITQRIQEAKRFRPRALRQEHGDTRAAVVREADSMLLVAERAYSRLLNERVAVDIHITEDQTTYRQMFYDIAENALGITAAVRVRFDNRKVVNRALPPVMDHPLFVGRTDIENDRIGRGSEFFVSAKHIVEIIRSVQVGIEGRVGKVMERDLKDTEVARNAIRFLDLAVRVFPQYQELIAGTVSPETLRTTGMLGSPATLRMLASVYYELRSDRHQWSDEQIADYFRVLEPHLGERAHAESVWIQHLQNDEFTLDAYAPDVRRQNIGSAVRHLVDWAILGEAGAPFLWERSPAPATSSDVDSSPEPAGVDVVRNELLKRRQELEAEMAALGKIR